MTTNDEGKVNKTDVLKGIILEFLESDLQQKVERELKFSHLTGKATILIGVRRCGKSTFMYQIINQLLQAGIDKSNILFLNFFDDRLHFLRESGLEIINEAYFSLYPEKKKSQTVYYFFDEIQMIPDWENFIDRIMRTENCEVYLSGSSAVMLSREIATQMRGRSLSWELFPFSFSEFLRATGMVWKFPISPGKRYEIQKAFDSFWETGGFPEVIGLPHLLRIKIHQDYWNAILFRDLIERHNISVPRALTDLAHKLVNNIASMYTINSLTGYLKSLGHKVPKTTVADFVNWFEDSYFLFTVKLFDASANRSNVNPKKNYCIDHSMVRSVSSGILVNSGHLLENLVFNALRTISQDIFYYRTKSGKEVDFIFKGKTGDWELIQVSETLSQEQTRRREIVALDQAMSETGIQSATIVTRSDEDEFLSDAGPIRIIPAWKFLLETTLTTNGSVQN